MWSMSALGFLLFNRTFAKSPVVYSFQKRRVFDPNPEPRTRKAERQKVRSEDGVTDG
jgi:hypothetical protein